MKWYISMLNKIMEICYLMEVTFGKRYSDFMVPANLMIWKHFFPLFGVSSVETWDTIFFWYTCIRKYCKKPLSCHLNCKIQIKWCNCLKWLQGLWIVLQILAEGNHVNISFFFHLARHVIASSLLTESRSVLSKWNH